MTAVLIGLLSGQSAACRGGLHDTREVAHLLLPFRTRRQGLPLLIGYHMQVVGIFGAEVIVANGIAMGVQRDLGVYRFSVLVIREQRDAWQ